MTAVEFLIQQILKHDKSFIEFYNAEIQQAKEMEKQQIMEAYDYGQAIPPFDYAEKYYNETYKKDKL
jgi:hypothetical protein